MEAHQGRRALQRAGRLLNVGVEALEQILGSLSLPMPDEPPTDLGSPQRTHVFVVGDVVVKCDAADRVGSGSMVRERAALRLLEH